MEKVKVIEATLENVSLVIQKLNNQNWGSWKLPAMSIGYSANQYDCEGKIITTMKFDKPINGSTKFKSGSKRGHLEKFRNINERF